MIVVIGSPSVLPGDAGQRSTAAGRAVEVARGAGDAGSTVQLVGKIGDDPAGDALILALADAGIGHVAILRDPARSTPVAPAPPADEADFDADFDALALEGGDDPVAGEPARGDRPAIDAGDLDLALRYLPDHRVVVVAQALAPEALDVVLADCAYVGATLVAILERGGTAPDLPPDATVFEAPDADPDGVFGRTVGGFAAALDQGADPAHALARAATTAGWQPASG